MIPLETLIQGLGIRVASGDARSLSIADLADDSRRVAPGSLFIARTGPAESGEAYIRDAAGRGAAAVLTRAAPDVRPPDSVAHLVADAVDQALTGRLAERFFGHPARKLALVGVTGTSGKTTTAYLVQHLLDRLGWRCGLIGTIVLDDGQDRRPAELTTPGALDFSRLLAAMVEHGCRAAVAEVSSHALHQRRTAALSFDAGVLTNLTGDHLDYHGHMDAYADAKAILFEQLGPDGWAIVNADDPYGRRMVRHCTARRLWTRVSHGDDAGLASTPTPRLTSIEGGALAAATIHQSTATHTRATFAGPWGEIDATLPLVGAHNVANTLQALATVHALLDATGAPSRADWREALESAPQAPGRLERVVAASAGGAAVASAPGAGPTVLVDYAHKTDALDNVLRALRPLVAEGGRLVCVFGCGGDRDRTKRPRMAAVACRWADRVIITSDNPRTEDPRAIIEDVLRGVPPDASASEAVLVEPDRAEAIRLAIAAADARDTVLIAGKGHEDYQIIGRTKRHFDDREQAAAALRDWPSAHRAECEV